MKATGIVRRADDLGRIVVPKEIRKTLGIGIGDPVEFFVDGQRLIVQKYNTAGSVEELLDRLEKEIVLKRDLMPAELMDKLLAKTGEMKAIVGRNPARRGQ